MEISIRWNICRVCLQEEHAENPNMKPIFNESRIAKQIVECAGIELSTNDGLPEKICRKCLLTLKYAVTFRNTCRKSDEYLRSVIEKTKEATLLGPADDVVVDDLEDVLAESDDGSCEFMYIVSDIDEERMAEAEIAEDAAVQEEKNTKISKSRQQNSVNKRSNYNLIDLTKGEDATEGSDNCFSVEIVPSDPLTQAAIEENEEEELRLSTVVKTEGSVDENEAYAMDDSQEDGEASQNEDPNYEYIKLRLSNESDEEYILGEEDVVDSDDEHASTDEVAIKRERTQKAADNSMDKKIISIKKSAEGTAKICDHCGNTFSSIQALKLHIRNMHKKRLLECELCGKRFATPSNLSAHMRIHTGERRYECKYCHRRFTDRSTHIKHERNASLLATEGFANYVKTLSFRSIHTNEKPFKCEVCQKAFSLSTSLKAHIRIHTGEKPFECQPCKKAFKLPHQLKAHLNTLLHKQVVTEIDKYVKSET